VQWRKYQDRSKPERLVFIETFIETWARTVIHGQSRQSQRQSRTPVDSHRDARPFSLSKYSAELNLIEQIFAKLKQLPRDAAARSVEASCAVIAPILAAFISVECANYFSKSRLCVSPIAVMHGGEA
jgi:hypothetical protein